MMSIDVDEGMRAHHIFFFSIKITFHFVIATTKNFLVWKNKPAKETHHEHHLLYFPLWAHEDTRDVSKTERRISIFFTRSGSNQVLFQLMRRILITLFILLLLSP